MRCANPATSKEAAEHCGDVHLSRLAAQGVNARIKRRITALHGIDRERARHQCGGKYALDLRKTRKRQRRRHLCAVQKRKSLFRAEIKGLEARKLKAAGGGHDAARDTYVTHPQK